VPCSAKRNGAKIQSSFALRSNACFWGIVGQAVFEELPVLFLIGKESLERENKRLLGVLNNNGWINSEENDEKGYKRKR